MAESLKNKAIHATKWSMYSQLVQYLLNFALSIILARILTPEDFGLTGMLVIFTSLSNIFINSGLSVALVRAVDVSDDDLSTMFVFNFTVSVFLYLILFFLAPYVASFYNEPSLVLLMRLMTLVFVVNSLGIVQNTILLRKVELKKQTICYLAGMALSVVVSASMALNNCGVYSIVGQVLSQAFGTNVLLWLTNKWTPKFRFNTKSFRKQWKVGSKILSTNLLSSVIDNVDNVLIGKVFSATNLGFFVRAKSTKQIPESIFWGTLNSSSFAILSKISRDKQEFNRMHLYYYNFALYLYLPIVIGLMVLAAPVVEVLYSARWLPAVPLLQIMCLGSIPLFIDGLFTQSFMAIGEVNTYLKVTFLKKIVIILSIPIGLIYGMIPYTISIVCFQFFGWFLNVMFLNKIIHIKFTNYIKDIFIPIIIAISMGVFLYYFQILVIIKNKFLLLLVNVFIGVFWYVFFSMILNVKQFVLIRKILRNSKYLKRITWLKL